MKKGNYILELDFIRAFCALGIVFYHFCPYSNNVFFQRLGTFYSGVDFGSLCVTVFFILSGVVLFHNYRQIDSPALYFWKRWKAIFPSFYLIYILFTLINLLKHREWFFDKPLYTLPLSLIGLDGYCAASMPTWYIIGEWFLGAIIILYCLYPLLNLLFQKCEVGTCITIVALFILTSQFEMLGQAAFRNIFSCVFSFSVGIFIEKHEVYKNKIVLWGGVIGIWPLILIPNHFHFDALNNLAGIFAFFALFAAGKYIMRAKFVSYILKNISNASYEIFLFQHLMIAKIASMWNPSSIALTGVLLLITVVVTYIAAYFVSIVTRYFLKRKPFTSIERLIIK